jgi:hypothetical protein
MQLVGWLIVSQSVSQSAGQTALPVRDAHNIPLSVIQDLTYLLTYLLTHSLTHSLTHYMVQEITSKADKSLSLSKKSFMGPEGSLPCSQKPVAGPYPEPAELIQDINTSNCVVPKTR